MTTAGLYECPDTGKLAHPDEDSAREHRDRLARREDPVLAHRIKVYPCGGHWHVGRRRRRSERRSRT